MKTNHFFISLWAFFILFLVDSQNELPKEMTKIESLQRLLEARSKADQGQNISTSLYLPNQQGKVLV